MIMSVARTLNKKNRDFRVFCEYDDGLLELRSQLGNSIKLAKFPSPKFKSCFESIFQSR